MACLRLVGHKLYIRLRLVAISDGVLEAGRPQTLHPITPSAISDGVFKACRAQTLHPITASAGSDGVSVHKRSIPLHPITASATSDGVPVQKRPNSLHPSTHSAKSDGTPAFIRPNPMERPQFTTKNFRPQVPRDRKQDFLPSVTNQFTISYQFRSFPKLLSFRLVP